MTTNRIVEKKNKDPINMLVLFTKLSIETFYASVTFFIINCINTFWKKDLNVHLFSTRKSEKIDFWNLNINK